MNRPRTPMADSVEAVLTRHRAVNEKRRAELVAAQMYTDAHIRTETNALANKALADVRDSAKAAAKRAAELIVDAQKAKALAQAEVDDRMNWQRIVGKQAEYAAALATLPTSLNNGNDPAAFIRRTAARAADVDDQHTIRALATAGAEVIAKTPDLKVAFSGYARAALGPSIDEAEAQEMQGRAELWHLTTVLMNATHGLGVELNPNMAANITREAITPYQHLLMDDDGAPGDISEPGQ